MTYTKNFNFNYIHPSQLNKDISVNEFMTFVDILLRGVVISANQSNCPDSANDGDCYIVPSVADGTWSEYKNYVAIFSQNLGWSYISPKEGFKFFALDDKNEYIFLNEEWSKTEIQKPVDIKPADYENYGVVKLGSGFRFDQYDKLEVDIAHNFPDVSYNKALSAKHGSELFDMMRGKNYVLNGDFQIWQRGNVLENNFGSIMYFCDRWFGVRDFGHSNLVVSKQEDLKFGDVARIQRKSGNNLSGAINFVQIIDSKIAQKLASKTVTLSAYIRLGQGFNKKVYMTLISGTAKDEGGSPYGFATGSKSCGGVDTQAVQGEWKKISLTCKLDDNVKSLLIQFRTEDLNYVANENDYFELAFVKLETGQRSTEFEQNDYDEELQKCKVYYSKLTSDISPYISNGFVKSSRQVCGIYSYPVQMRAIPKISISSQSAIAVDTQNWSVSSSISTLARLTSVKIVVNFSVNLVVGRGAELVVRENECIEFDAEIY